MDGILGGCELPPCSDAVCCGNDGVGHVRLNWRLCDICALRLCWIVGIDTLILLLVMSLVGVLVCFCLCVAWPWRCGRYFRSCCSCRSGESGEDELGTMQAVMVADSAVRATRPLQSAHNSLPSAQHASASSNTRPGPAVDGGGMGDDDDDDDGGGGGGGDEPSRGGADDVDETDPAATNHFSSGPDHATSVRSEEADVESSPAAQHRAGHASEALHDHGAISSFHTNSSESDESSLGPVERDPDHRRLELTGAAGSLRHHHSSMSIRRLGLARPSWHANPLDEGTTTNDAAGPSPPPSGGHTHVEALAPRECGDDMDDMGLLALGETFASQTQPDTFTRERSRSSLSPPITCASPSPSDSLPGVPSETPPPPPAAAIHTSARGGELSMSRRSSGTPMGVSAVNVLLANSPRTSTHDDNGSHGNAASVPLAAPSPHLPRSSPRLAASARTGGAPHAADHTAAVSDALHRMRGGLGKRRSAKLSIDPSAALRHKVSSATFRAIYFCRWPLLLMFAVLFVAVVLVVLQLKPAQEPPQLLSSDSNFERMRHMKDDVIRACAGCTFRASGDSGGTPSFDGGSETVVSCPASGCGTGDGDGSGEAYGALLLPGPPLTPLVRPRPGVETQVWVTIEGPEYTGGLAIEVWQLLGWVFGVWCLVFGAWCLFLVFGVWCLVLCVLSCRPPGAS